MGTNGKYCTDPSLLLESIVPKLTDLITSVELEYFRKDHTDEIVPQSQLSQIWHVTDNKQRADS